MLRAPPSAEIVGRSVSTQKRKWSEGKFRSQNACASSLYLHHPCIFKEVSQGNRLWETLADLGAVPN